MRGYAIIGFVSLVMLSMYAYAKPDKLYVLDNANILTTNQKQEINYLLHQYFSNHHFEFNLITVDSLKNGSIDELGNKMVKNLAPGFPGLNNYALLIISLSTKEIEIKPGEGLIWQLTNESQKEIVGEIKKYFLSGDFYSGIKVGFQLMKEKSAMHTWKISYESFKELSFDQKNATGKILFVQVVSSSSKLNHPEAVKIQFHPSFFITVSGDNATEAKLFYSSEMIDTVKNLLQGSAKIYARVSKNQPLELQLLGVVR